jgi:hypothetical protein
MLGDQCKGTCNTVLDRNRGRNSRRDRRVDVYRLADAATAAAEQNRRPGARPVPVNLSASYANPLSLIAD